MKTEIGLVKSIISGYSEGLAVVSREPFSFSEINSKTGIISNPRSELFGESIKDKVFVFPYGRGTSCSSAGLAEAIRCRTAPCAIINIKAEQLLVIGALVAESLYDRTVPIIDISPDVFQLLQTGDYLFVDASNGKLYKRQGEAKPKNI